jgi:Putative MetA-pathway of phenol degradation
VGWTARWRRSGALLAVLLLSKGAYGAHPLNTEDTGTQGSGGWQLELNGERNRDEGVRGAQAMTVLSYGVADNVDLQAAMPWQDLGDERGIGDALVAIKWRFWEQGAFSLGTRAGFLLPTADEQRGLGNGKTNFAALLIGSYEGERWLLHAHAGYRDNRNTLGNRRSVTELSAAVLYKVTEQIRPLLDVSRITNTDPASGEALQNIVLGVIWQATKQLDLDLGLRFGNQPAIDRALMLGMTLRW